MADSNTNAEHAAAAAAAVDPNSPEQKAIIARATTPTPGQSYADRIAGKSADPTQADNSFFAGLEKAGAQKARLQAGSEVGPDDETEKGDSEEQTPISERKPGDPPVARRQRSNFRKIEDQLKEARAQLAKLEAQHAGTNGNAATVSAAGAAASTPSDSAQLLALQKELDDARAEIALLDITRTPEFTQKFEAPRSIAIKQAKNIAGAKGADVEAVLNMAPGALRDAKLDELLKELPASTAAIVNAANNKLAEIEFYKGVEVENARASAQDRFKQRQAHVERQIALDNATFDRQVAEWSAAVPALAANNPQRAAIIAQAKEIFAGTKLTAQQRSSAALQAALTDSLIAESEAAYAEIDKLQRQLARFTNGLPGGGDASQDTDEPARPKDARGRDQDFMQGLQKAIKSDPMHSAFRRQQNYF